MDRATLDEIDRLLGSLRNQLALVASKAIVELVKDSIGLQGLQVSVLTDEVFDEDTEHMQQGGISHVPLAGSEGVFLSLGGVRDDGVVLCVSHRRHRPKGGQGGETVVYNAGDHQSTIWLRQDGSVVITSGGDTPSTFTMTPSGAVNVVPGDRLNVGNNPTSALALAQATDQRIAALENAFSTFINTTFNLHTHVGAAPGSPTAVPVPVGTPPTPGQTTASQLSFSL